MHNQLADRFGTRYAVERKMHRDTIIYYVLALDPNGDLAARARTSKDLLAGVPAFIARAVLSLKRDRINEVMVWPDHRRRGIASALYRLIEADLGRPLAAEPHSDGGGPSVLDCPGGARQGHRHRQDRQAHRPRHRDRSPPQAGNGTRWLKWSGDALHVLAFQ
jgi:GNAT superfamily N-acetyltransferase